jgi:hypothetical protein
VHGVGRQGRVPELGEHICKLSLVRFEDAGLNANTVQPLLIASSVIRDAGDRDRVRQLLKIFAYQCCYEIEILSCIVEAVWVRLDQGRDSEATSWREVTVEIGWPVLIG